MRSDLKKLDEETSKNHLIRNCLRNGRVRIKMHPTAINLYLDFKIKVKSLKFGFQIKNRRQIDRIQLFLNRYSNLLKLPVQRTTHGLLVKLHFFHRKTSVNRQRAELICIYFFKLNLRSNRKKQT